jgi:hypothetical protein
MGKRPVEVRASGGAGEAELREVCVPKLEFGNEGEVT